MMILSRFLKKVTKVDSKTVSRFAKFSRLLLPYYKIVAVILLLTFLTVPLSIVNPYLSKLLIDRAYPNRDLRLFIILALIGGSVFLMNILLRNVSTYFTKYVRLKVSFDLKRRFFRKIKMLDFAFFQNTSVGQHMYKATRDVEATTNFIVDTWPEFIHLIPRVALVLIMVIYLDWKLALLSIILAPLLYLPPYYFTRRLRDLLSKSYLVSEQIFSKLHRIFSQIYLIKTFGKENKEAREYIHKVAENTRLNWKNARLEAFSVIASNLVNRGVTGLIVLYGGYRIIKGDLTLGSFTSIMIYLNQLIRLQGSFASLYQIVMLGLVSCERLDYVFEIEPRIKESPSAVSATLAQGSISFKNVSFSYNPDKLILNDISVSIRSSAKIALVGHSGCGKTTLLSLLLRLFEPREGEIYIYEYNIRDLTFKALRDQIGVALQEPFLWDDTIENNIRYAKDKASFQEIERAARTAQIDDFILSLPQRYKTIIGESACKLSQGQKQRIAIARAVIKQPKILILDEAMSSLDSETEDKIIDGIKHDFVNSTVIVVSHRLSTVRRMDLVYFFIDSHTILVGSHEEMLKKEARYSELFASQVRSREGIAGIAGVKSRDSIVKG